MAGLMHGFHLPTSARALLAQPSMLGRYGAINYATWHHSSGWPINLGVIELAGDEFFSTPFVSTAGPEPQAATMVIKIGDLSVGGGQSYSIHPRHLWKNRNLLLLSPLGIPFIPESDSWIDEAGILTSLIFLYFKFAKRELTHRQEVAVLAMYDHSDNGRFICAHEAFEHFNRYHGALGNAAVSFGVFSAIVDSLVALGCIELMDNEIHLCERIERVHPNRLLN